LTARAIHLARGEGESVRNPLGGPIEVKARGLQTGGALTAFVSSPAPGEGPPLHLHTEENEVLYFLDGRFRLRLEDTVNDAPAGSFTFIPKGVAHTWQNSGDAPARLLVIFTPASARMERFFERFAEHDSASAAAGFTALAGDAGMKVLGPPLAQTDPLP
jgi:quercetin dioxygenase-like cupin family protein